MADHLTSELNVGLSMTDLWNDKLILSARIEELVKPFQQKYRLYPDSIEISYGTSGCWIKVTL